MSDIREAIEKAVAALEKYEVPDVNRTVWVPERIYNYGPEEFERAARSMSLKIEVVPSWGIAEGVMFYVDAEVDKE